jgi:hypothetical protein
VTKYKLQSAPMLSAPGLIAWAINGYHFERDRETLANVVKATWPGVPMTAVEALLSEAVPYTVEAEAVVFEFEPPPITEIDDGMGGRYRPGVIIALK